MFSPSGKSQRFCSFKMDEKVVLREQFKRTGGMCGFSVAHLCFASSTGHAAQQVSLGPAFSEVTVLLYFLCVFPGYPGT